MSPERAQVDGRDYGTPGPQSMFALTNSVRTALVAGTVSIALSAAHSSQLMASAMQRAEFRRLDRTEIRRN
jgi:hypothetical protein